MAIDKKFSSSSAAKAAGWFSTRHQSNQPHLAAKERRKEKFELRRQRELNPVKRSPEEQLKRLDVLLGKNNGAKKERAKLKARIANSKKPAEIKENRVTRKKK